LVPQEAHCMKFSNCMNFLSSHFFGMPFPLQLLELSVQYKL
jgi:hypothetical protein